MTPVVGPILHFRSATSETWSLRVLVVTPDKGRDRQVVFRSAVGLVNADLRPMFTFAVAGQKRFALIADLTLPRAGAEQVWMYRLEEGGRPVVPAGLGERIGAGDDEGWIGPVVVPGHRELPRVAFVTGNGFEHPTEAAATIDPDAPWRHLSQCHDGTGAAGGPLHLLIGGGGQLAADALWSRESELADFLESGRASRSRTRESAHRRRRLTARWIDGLQRGWHRGGLGWAAARIPGIYTWSDRDVLSGWGASDEHHDPDGFGFWSDVIVAAGMVFDVVQCGQTPGHERFRSFSIRSAAGTMAIWLLDDRSHRRPDQTLGARQWIWLEEQMRQLASAPVDQLLVVCATPPVWLGGPRTDTLGPGVPGAVGRIDDWATPARRGERARLLSNLAELQAGVGTRITLLCGGTDVAARAEVQLRHPDVPLAPPLHQLVPGSILRPPPGALELAGRVALATEDTAISERIEARLRPVGGAALLRARGYLTLQPELHPDHADLRVHWVAEHADGEVARVPEELVVHGTRRG